MEQLKKSEPVDDTMTLPTTTTLKERYKRIQNDLSQRGFESLHKLTRQRITALLDEVESKLQNSEAS